MSNITSNGQKQVLRSYSLFVVARYRCHQNCLDPSGILGSRLGVGSSLSFSLDTRTDSILRRLRYR
jgi:hypothetical protein